MSNVHQQGYDAYRNLQLGAAIVDSSLKGYKAGKYAAAAYHAAKLGYGLGKYVVNSFSKNEKNMPPVRARSLSKTGPVQKRGRSRTPKLRSMSPRQIAMLKSTPRKGKSVTVARGVRRQPMHVWRGGASTSKSAGRFGKGTSKLQTLDEFAKKGIVYCLEYGGVLTDTAGPFSQSQTIGHANYTQFTLQAQVAYALCKMISARLNIILESMEDLISDPTAGGFIFTLGWLPYPTAPMQYSTYNTSLGGKWSDIAKWFYGRISAHYNSTTWSTLEIQQYNKSGSTVNTAIRRALLDLTKARVHLYSKSALKIQNRTINVAGNVEADDVDNVPLYGKSYQGKGNNCYFHLSDAPLQVIKPNGQTVDSTMFAVPTTVIKYPVFTYKHQVGTFQAEPQGKAQFSKVSTVGKAHLDPAQIKTDVLVFRKSYNLNTLIRSKLNYFPPENATPDDTISIGKFRFFTLEKMIQAVATVAASSITVAFEQDVKYGCMITAPNKGVTNYILDQVPV